MTDFKHTIQRFQVLPNWLVGLFSWLFVGCELIVVILIVLGGTSLGLGFALAVFLLSIFSVALISVLARKIQTSCNCFGSNEKSVSKHDVGRNIIFILCAFMGLQFYSSIQGHLISPNLLEFDWVISVHFCFDRDESR